MSVKELIDALNSLNCPGAEVLADPANSDTLKIHFVSGGLAGGVRLECEEVDWDEPPESIRERIQDLESIEGNYGSLSRWAAKVYGLIKTHGPVWVSDELLDEYPE
jgi:hypothetical protein